MAVDNMITDSQLNDTTQLGTSCPIEKRERDIVATPRELSHVENRVKKRRVIDRDRPSASGNLEESDTESAMLMRTHLIDLYKALRGGWKKSQLETCFDVFFGSGSDSNETKLQEAKITVKNARKSRRRSTSQPASSNSSNVVCICESITASLEQQNCLHLALEGGTFRRLRPQPKMFGGLGVCRAVSLSDFFWSSRRLTVGEKALSLKARHVLAFTLATALLLFLETPWMGQSFDSSSILFFQPPQDGELPSITKPCLKIEHMPTRIRAGARVSQADKGKAHPNASLRALGIILCELIKCTRIECIPGHTSVARSGNKVNADHDDSISIVKDMENDVGENYYLATMACLKWNGQPGADYRAFDSAAQQRLFRRNVIKRLEMQLFNEWKLLPEDLESLDARENELYWGPRGCKVIRDVMDQPRLATRLCAQQTGCLPLRLEITPPSYTYNNTDGIIQMSAQDSLASRPRLLPAAPVTEGPYSFDAKMQNVPEPENVLSKKWMHNLRRSIHHHVDSYGAASAGQVWPVRIAILDSGFDPENPHVRLDSQIVDPRIKDARSFVHQMDECEYYDQIGHGTHTLGLLLDVATSAEIFIGKVASQEIMDRESYDDIAKAINYAVDTWEVDIITMSFGIRENHVGMKLAILNALTQQTLLFAAASNDGGNLGRTFPARDSGVFCIHSTDGSGNPSRFNPTPDNRAANFSLLGEDVISDWPEGLDGHHDVFKVISGTSVATPIAAGIAASILSFVRQQDWVFRSGTAPLGPWLKCHDVMERVFQSMVRHRNGYDYIRTDLLFDLEVSREQVYNKIKDINVHMYK